MFSRFRLHPAVSNLSRLTRFFLSVVSITYADTDAKEGELVIRQILTAGYRTRYSPIVLAITDIEWHTILTENASSEKHNYIRNPSSCPENVTGEFLYA